ncbi:MAG: glycoside hydrolase family 31 protein [Myxococcota bacterium]
MPVELPSAHFAVALPGDALVLRRRGEPLLTVPLDDIALGEVAAYEDRRSYDPFWSDDLADGGVTWRRAEAAEPDGDAVHLTFDGGAEATLTLAAVAEGAFTVTLTPDALPAPVAYLRLGAVIDPDEGLYGLGSALDTPNRRGSVRAVQLEVDVATEALSNEAHVHLPFALGTTGWGLLLRDDHPTTFDFATEADDRLEVTVGLGPDAPAGLAFDLYAADHPLDVTQRYWAATGAFALPAPWALGPLVWRDENRDQAQVEDDLRTMRDLDLATSAIWLDRPYASSVNSFDFAPDQFPDPQAMIDLAHDLGFRVALWHTPYVDEDGASAPLHDEALANGWFPPERPPVFIDWGSPVDFSTPEAYGWWQGLVGRYAAMGIEGYKLDYAEEVLVGALGGRIPWTFANGADERTMHAEYQRLYHQVYAETLPESGGFLLVRSGAWGDQVHAPIVWPGDLDATMAAWGEPAVDRGGEAYTSVGGLPASLVDALSLGPSGFPLYGSDTGGYRRSPPDNETFVRWFEQTALSTVMQIGTSTNDVAWEPTAENGFDDDTLAWYRDYTRLHLRLWPYLWTALVDVNQGRGRPIMRPLGLAYPELGEHPGDTYLLGDHLLVAPVVTRGARERAVTFPPGRWIGWFDGVVHEPGTETVPADLGELPLYLAEGGIVPLLRPTIDTLAPVADEGVDSYATDPGVLYVRIFPGPASEAHVFDGTRIAQARDDDGTVTVRHTPGDTFVQGLVLELVGTPEPAAVALDGRPAPADAWSWAPDGGGTLTLRLPSGASATLTP